MKKKIIAICLVAVMAAVAIAGASLAYFTDTDEATNVFTVGGVQIKLHEQQRDGEGDLEDFEDEKILLPVVGSAQGAKDKYGLPTAENYVDKIVTVENTGKSDAYVRVLVAIPAALEGVKDDGSDNVLYWDVGNKFRADGQYDTTADPQPSNADYSTKCVYKDEKTTVEIDGIVYNIYSFTYTDVLEAGETTEYASLIGFYLDEKVDNRYDKKYDEKDEKIIYTINGEDIAYDLSQGVKIPVFAQAVQAAGFESAAAAFTAAGLTVNPWAN